MIAGRLVYLLFGFLSIINGLWMLLFPVSWYEDLPAGVPDTGPLNVHFVRDLGVVFVLIAAGFFWCARHLQSCLKVHWMLTTFFIGHALLHLIDLLSGRLPRSHWSMDLPAVFLPAVVLILLGVPKFRMLLKFPS
ncbi:MAG TPA: hypothetical protein VJ521_14880 [Acidobacteriota bacterium]|nr:hypothetical protein [Acidobacteriota bacterium]